MAPADKYHKYKGARPVVARARVAFAGQKFDQLSEADQRALSSDMNRLTKTIPHLSSQGALELMLMLGTFLNTHEIQT